MPPTPTQPEDEMYFENCKSCPIASFPRGKMNEPKRLLISQAHGPYPHETYSLVRKTGSVQMVIHIMSDSRKGDGIK